MARNSKGFYVHKRVGYVPDKRNYKHSHANEQGGGAGHKTESQQYTTAKLQEPSRPSEELRSGKTHNCNALCKTIKRAKLAHTWPNAMLKPQ